MAGKELDPRKEQILKVVTDDYIESAEPVGSRTIARKYNLGFSPATIRNEMADLEEYGYLKQPHTSAGRIPSNRGYRYYVDTLMQQRQLTEAEVEFIRVEFEDRTRRLDSLLQQTVKALSQVTKYPSLVLVPQLEEAIFRHIQLIPLNQTSILVLVVTDVGFVESKLIESPTPISQEELDRISFLLNEKLRGVSFRNLRSALLTEIRDELLDHSDFFHEAMQLLIKSLDSKKEDQVYIEGSINIMEQPEFREISKLKPLMVMLEEKDKLHDILSSFSSARGIKVHIGAESLDEVAQECSMVTASYEIKGRTLGCIGVLGPTRMDYAWVVAVVEYVSSHLSELLTALKKTKY